jgi:hypothetical protein
MILNQPGCGNAIMSKFAHGLVPRALEEVPNVHGVIAPRSISPDPLKGGILDAFAGVGVTLHLVCRNKSRW